jgi:hypothetical protein
VPSRVEPDRRWALPAAVAACALENAAVLGGLLLVGTAPTLVLLALTAKFGLCAGLVQRRHGAFMVLVLWEVVTLVVALLNPALAAPARVLLLASSGAALTFLGYSIPLFPTVAIRGVDAGGRPSSN